MWGFVAEYATGGCIDSQSVYTVVLNRYLVGIVANQGDLNEQSSLKGAHFIRLCSLRNIPLVFLVNTPPDPEFLSAHGSPGVVAKARAQMMAVLATANVPKISIVCGGSYGPSAYAMVSCYVHSPKIVVTRWFLVW